MTYVGIETQQRNNNLRSILLLILFPMLILGLAFIFFYTIFYNEPEVINIAFTQTIENTPIILGVVAIWFCIAYFFNTSIINSATQSKPLSRTEDKRIYNLVENLCMSQGMDMPKINVIEDNSLNAFASGLNKNNFTVTLTRGIINKLNDAELEGVIAHELMHIRNRDVRLLIVSIVFVGIFSVISQVMMRSALYNSIGSSKNKNNNNAALMIIIAILSFIGYLFSMMIRFAISRNREYMADAGAAQMTKQPLALASALRKISGNSKVSTVERDDIAQLFIDHPLKGGFAGLFATHPPIEKRIEILEQF